MDDWNDSDSGLAVRVASLEAHNRSLRNRAAELEAALAEARRFLVPSGKPAGVISVSHDTRDRTLAEEELRASEDRYRMVSELTTDFVFQLRIARDGTSAMEWISGPFAKVIGYTVDEYNMIGGWQVLCHPDDLAATGELYRLLLTGRQIEGEARLRCRSGEYRWMRYVNRPVCDPATGRVTGVIGAARDVTELKRTEKEREQLEQHLRQTQTLESIGILAGGIAHDFNNLLTVMLGNASLLEPMLPPGSPERASVEQIVEAARRAANMCAQLLAYAGKGPVLLHRLDLSGLLRDAAELLGSLTTGKTELRLEPADGLLWIDGDPVQLQQALINLVANAVEAVEGRAGWVRVRTEAIHADRALLDACVAHARLPDGEYVVLEVSDTGCGMAAETAAKLFDPFFTTKFLGRGLGLAAVHGIVRSHRGGVLVQTAPDVGTTFRLLFPVSRSSPVQISAPTPATGVILVVEDEDAIRDLDRVILEQAGFRVLTARDGHEGVELFHQHDREIKAVLLDLTMPGMAGRQVALELHQLRPEVPVVLTSGYSGDQALADTELANVAAFLPKPYTPADLLAIMRRVLGGASGG